MLHGHSLVTPAPVRSAAACLLFLSATVLPANAQDQQWITQLGTSRDDLVYDLASDEAGGVFAGGLTLGSLGGPLAGFDDAWLARFDGSGGQVWIRQLGTGSFDRAYGLARDGAGGVYVGGMTDGDLGGPNAGSDDAWLARFDGAGNQLWLRQFGTTEQDVIWDAEPDGSGGVFVCGLTRGSLAGPNAGSSDVWLARYDRAGNQVWARQVGTSSSEFAYAAAADGTGGVYLTGSTFGSLGGPHAGSWDAWVGHYDGAGSLSWLDQLGTTEIDGGGGVASDGSGGLYVSGGTGGSLGGPSAGSDDAWLARYERTGTRLWLRQFGTPELDGANAAVSDSSGGVYVAGGTGGDLGGASAGIGDAWLARYDSSGTRIWVDQFGSDNEERVFAAALDTTGEVYVGGETWGSLGGPNQGDFDVWLARYDGDCRSRVYCTASATSIPGCQPAIAGIGSASLADPSSFVISSGRVPGSNLGICFFGENGPASAPFGTLGGQVCVQGPFRRSAPKSSGGTPGVCDGVFSFTLQDLMDASTFIVPGAVIHAEIWARDPDNVDGFLLSDGLAFTVCP